jgi:hypothetical protein
MVTYFCFEANSAEDNIKMELQEVAWEVDDFILLAQARDQ